MVPLAYRPYNQVLLHVLILSWHLGQPIQLPRLFTYEVLLVHVMRYCISIYFNPLPNRTGTIASLCYSLILSIWFIWEHILLPVDLILQVFFLRISPTIIMGNSDDFFVHSFC